MKYYDNDLDVTVTETKTRTENIDGVFEELLKEYGLEDLSPEEIAERMEKEDYSGFFFENGEEFIDGYELTVTNAKGNVIGKISFADFNLAVMDAYITDIYDLMDSLNGDYEYLFSTLYRIGYDYNTDEYILPGLLYISDIVFNTKDNDERFTVMEALRSYFRRRLQEDNFKDRYLLAYIAAADDDRFLLRANRFREIPETDLFIADIYE